VCDGFAAAGRDERSKNDDDLTLLSSDVIMTSSVASSSVRRDASKGCFNAAFTDDSGDDIFN